MKSWLDLTTKPRVILVFTNRQLSDSVAPLGRSGDSLRERHFPAVKRTKPFTQILNFIFTTTTTLSFKQCKLFPITRKLDKNILNFVTHKKKAY